LATYVAAILSGLYLALWMALPNWFLGIGKVFIDWLLPGLISGPLIALALSRLPLGPWEPSQTKRGKIDWKQFFRRLQKHAFQILLIIGASTLAFGLGRISERLTMGVIDPWWWEVVLWGFGGAILGSALSIGWLAWPISTPIDQPT
jgi:hypothetical protein